MSKQRFVNCSDYPDMGRSGAATVRYIDLNSIEAIQSRSGVYPGGNVWWKMDVYLKCGKKLTINDYDTALKLERAIYLNTAKDYAIDRDYEVMLREDEEIRQSIAEKDRLG